MSQFFQQAVNALGWALLHFVWQGSLVALGLTLFLSFIGCNHIRARYFFQLLGFDSLHVALCT